MVLDVGAFLFLNLLSNFNNDVLNELQLFLLTDQRDHDLRNDVVAALFLNLDGSLHNGTGLHLCDLRISNSQTASTVTHHRVELMELITFCFNNFNSQTHILCKVSHLLSCLRSELMQRRI